MTGLHIRLIIAAVASIGFLPATGQETMVLKNGSRLYGHTSKEDFRANSITFMADSGLVVENINDIYYTAPTAQRLSNMNDTWRQWFERHPALVFVNGGKKCGHLGSISYTNDAKRPFEGEAVIVERSDSDVTFFSLGHPTVTINKNKEVDHFEYEPRDPLALAGTVDEVIPVSGPTMRGQIVADYPSRLVLLTDDGVRNVIPYSNIKSKRIAPLNPNLSLPQQLRFFSHITYIDDNGEQKEVDGIIREIVYKPSGNERPYYEVLNADGSTPRKYAFDKVVALSLTRNKDNKVNERDVVINDGEILIERMPAASVKHTITTERYEINDTTGTVKVSLADLKDGDLRVYFKDLPENSDFIFVEAKRDYTPDDNGKKRRDDEPAQQPVYFYARLSEMMFNNYSPRNRVVSPLSNVSVDYGPVAAGHYYLLTRLSDKSTYLIKVEP